ncbi:hypothetical protein [Lentibacillus sp. CBA3610]|uniref:hypothetical protein n=1 Tax=Lentibacillus sp. CBA3610 TaxID=2518176 RepID=UPI001595ED90|nr:hypothetical protein [Lentibacillus sp. CBA3610]QKY69179.1 hypothetical protein Len3610_05745 [Lentibacillus sp. CBA3610]
MTNMITISPTVDGIEKRKFANALSDMGNQLRLMEQKITMMTDNRVQEDYTSQQKELNHITYTVNKLHRKQQKQHTEKLVPGRFTFNHAEKRLSNG